MAELKCKSLKKTKNYNKKLPEFMPFRRLLFTKFDLIWYMALSENTLHKQWPARPTCSTSLTSDCLCVWGWFLMAGLIMRRVINELKAELTEMFIHLKKRKYFLMLILYLPFRKNNIYPNEKIFYFTKKKVFLAGFMVNCAFSYYFYKSFVK